MDGGDSAKPPVYELSDGRRRNMRANKRRDTLPEKALRSVLHRAGLRFRVDFRLDLGGVRVRPDVVFTKAKVAIFVDGCFWHSCPVHGRRTSTNEDYWGPKLRGNRLRDEKQDHALGLNGWVSLRYWEHEDPRKVATAVIEVLRSRGYPVREKELGISPASR